MPSFLSSSFYFWPLVPLSQSTFSTDFLFYFPSHKFSFCHFLFYFSSSSKTVNHFVLSYIFSFLHSLISIFHSFSVSPPSVVPFSILFLSVSLCLFIYLWHSLSPSFSTYCSIFLFLLSLSFWLHLTFDIESWRQRWPFNFFVAGPTWVLLITALWQPS